MIGGCLSLWATPLSHFGLKYIFSRLIFVNRNATIQQNSVLAREFDFEIRNCVHAKAISLYTLSNITFKRKSLANKLKSPEVTECCLNDLHKIS